jgi:hypothetical protein
MTCFFACKKAIIIAAPAQERPTLSHLPILEQINGSRQMPSLFWGETITPQPPIDLPAAKQLSNKHNLNSVDFN